MLTSHPPSIRLPGFAAACCLLFSTPIHAAGFSGDVLLQIAVVVAVVVLLPLGLFIGALTQRFGLSRDRALFWVSTSLLMLCVALTSIDGSVNGRAIAATFLFGAFWLLPAHQIGHRVGEWLRRTRDPARIGATHAGHVLRWSLLPWAYGAAALLGIHVWLQASAALQQACPPERAWLGAGSNTLHCRWDLWVHVLKDTCGAALSAAFSVGASALLAPSHRRAAALGAATFSAILGCAYLATTFEPRLHVPGHRFAVAASLLAVLALTTAYCRARVPTNGAH